MVGKFTQGPWEFDGVCQIVEAARPHMRVAFLPSDHAEYASSKPNGYLIAAAPELFKALYFLDNLLDFGDESLEPVWTFEDLSDVRAAFEQARGALRAASGEVE